MAGDAVDLSKGGGTGTSTEVSLPKRDRWVLVGGGLVLGGLVGLLLPPLSGWILDLPVVPFERVVAWVAGLSGGWVPPVAAAIGALLGALGGAVLVSVCMRVTLEDGTVRIDKEGKHWTLPGPEIGAVFLDGRELVVLDRATRHLYRGESDVDAGELAAAFTAHGYRWVDADPHATEFSRWIPGTPDLPAAAHAILRARRSALEKKDTADATELREEAERLGYTLRDKGERQYWRRLGESGVADV
ncbi:hypothetical protein ACIPPS_12105 [Streptomyces sp. NPDC090127]|uniref:YqeB family protein n=1 Tax=Streptomyces sp. NPDC090127 TaxID=3365953 RepID=UPI003830E196